MWNLIRKYRNIPEEKKIIVYGKLAFLKSLSVFLFKIIVGIVFHSWFVIAIALYGLCIGMVKHNCSHGLKHNTENIKDIHNYIRGGIILAVSSLIYIAYSLFQVFGLFASEFNYNLPIAIIISGYAIYGVAMSFWGVIHTKGKTMLIKEYKFTNFATAFNNITLAHVGILSFLPVENQHLYNGLVGVFVGTIITFVSIFLVCDGFMKKKKYFKIVKVYPKIIYYINAERETHVKPKYRKINKQPTKRPAVKEFPLNTTNTEFTTNNKE